MTLVPGLIVIVRRGMLLTTGFPAMSDLVSLPAVCIATGAFTLLPRERRVSSGRVSFGSARSGACKGCSFPGHKNARRCGTRRNTGLLLSGLSPENRKLALLLVHSKKEHDGSYRAFPDGQPDNLPGFVNISLLSFTKPPWWGCSQDFHQCQRTRKRLPSMKAETSNAIAIPEPVAAPVTVAKVQYVPESIETITGQELAAYYDRNTYSGD